MSNAILFVEIFPIRIEKIPSLFAYKVSISSGDLATIGGKLSYRLRRKFGQHWVWTSGHILTDAPQNQPEMDAFVEKLWENEPDTYRTSHSIYVQTKPGVYPPKHKQILLQEGCLRTFVHRFSKCLITLPSDWTKYR